MAYAYLCRVEESSSFCVSVWHSSFSFSMSCVCDCIMPSSSATLWTEKRSSIVIIKMFSYTLLWKERTEQEKARDQLTDNNKCYLKNEKWCRVHCTCTPTGNKQLLTSQHCVTKLYINNNNLKLIIPLPCSRNLDDWR